LGKQILRKRISTGNSENNFYKWLEMNHKKGKRVPEKEKNSLEKKRNWEKSQAGDFFLPNP